MVAYFSTAFPSIEAAYNLPTGVLDAVISQESGGNPLAMRFEQGFFDRYIKGVDAGLLGGKWPIYASDATERIGRATSWGLMQVMGQTARELGFEGAFFSLLCANPGIGVDFGARCLRSKLNKWPDLGDALSAYNSGKPTDSNRSTYVSPILKRMEASRNA